MSRSASSRKKKSATPVPAPVSIPTNPAVAPLTPYQPDSDLQKMGDQAQEYLEDYAFEIASPVQRIKWFGKVYQLGQSIKNDHVQGHLGNISLERALTQACDHYVHPDGTPFTPKSIRESLREHERKFVEGRLKP